MSGYRDHRSRQSSRELSREISRERSPTGSRRTYRDDRSRSNSYNDPRGSQDQGRQGFHSSSSRGIYSNRGSTSYSSSTSEMLPDLPAETMIPSTGGRLRLSMPNPQGRLGHPINLLVNHFALQSLPTIKVLLLRLCIP